MSADGIAVSEVLKEASEVRMHVKAAGDAVCCNHLLGSETRKSFCMACMQIREPIAASAGGRNYGNFRALEESVI